MRAHLRTDSLGNLTILMEGGLDFENNIPLRAELEQIVEKNHKSDITLDLGALDFVGSSGLGIFVETIRILNRKKNDIKITNVKSEFIKVFKLYNLDCMDAIIQDFDSDETQDLNTKYGNRKFTFQN